MGCWLFVWEGVADHVVFAPVLSFSVQALRRVFSARCVGRYLAPVAWTGGKALGLPAAPFFLSGLGIALRPMPEWPLFCATVSSAVGVGFSGMTCRLILTITFASTLRGLVALLF